MKRTFPILSAVLLIAFLLSGCADQPAAQPAAAAAAAQQPETVIAEGRLEPSGSLDQAFSLPGQVAEVLVQDGQSVQAGQALARLSDTADSALALARAEEEALAAQQALDALDSGADLALAQARTARWNAQQALDEAQETFDADESEENEVLLQDAQAVFEAANDRFITLNSGRGIDRDQRAAAQARLRTAQAAVLAAQSALDARTLTASSAGTVIDLDLQPGQQVSAGQPLLTLADTSQWIVRTDNLTESEVVAVQVGQQVQVTLDALPGQPLTGEVTRINARFEEKRGDITYTVTARLDGVPAGARWGMTAAVRFLP